jgi:hypothetical protein
VFSVKDSSSKGDSILVVNVYGLHIVDPATKVLNEI